MLTNGTKKGCLVVYYLIFATLFAFIVPPLEGPDEFAHLDYVNFVAATSRLPDTSASVSGDIPMALAHHPPLYYILAALVTRLFNEDRHIDIRTKVNQKHEWHGGRARRVPVHMHLFSDIFPSRSDRTTFYFLRMLSVLMGLGTVLYVIRISGLFIEDSRLSLFPAFFVVTLPQFLFISGMISNDNLVTLFSTMGIYYAMRLLGSPDDIKSFLLLGVALGLGIMAKRSALVLVPGILGCLTYVTLKNRERLARIGTGILLFFCCTLLITGFAFVRGWLTQGSFLGFEAEKAATPYLVAEKTLLSPYLMQTFIPRMFETFVGDLGFTGLDLPWPVYIFYLALVLVACCGFALLLIRSRFTDVKIILAVVMVASCLAGIVIYNLTFSQPHGRFLFPVISLIAIQFTLGLSLMLSEICSEKTSGLLAELIALGWIACDVVSVLWAHNFYYTLENYLP